ncbi:DNA polymerase III subunit delta' [Testudinibacter sp. TR-2022]|uniref:DNA polymerase III subunit delta' n=1 Tax=Testudinibacter sp. TR-2022 TaxID=2585029 RepID=UPI001117AEB0|nr:DNA polymerase III subunit delta' [Testudinibacter sp. TR-2022]TNH04412.1 DNA polymerase III subunit delta' [Pasteurellaceae bacterium Phil11]TNH21230.1 DNA polymerase III subunit delta' [Testudinibacter sp. TR-2022]TNH22654.1 DNA polymerase III subunit delta' [Testudinibacter sp. TR-2022]
MYPWFAPLFQQLDAAFAAGHGHHALLFKSEPGLGSETLLNAIAKGLLCQTAPGLQACGHCQHCQLFDSGNHPDLHRLLLQDGKNIGIDQVRELIANLQQYARQDGNKVVYLPTIELLSEAAANALLKTLEEPTDQTYFVLLADITAPLMPTIYSRCQVQTLIAPSVPLATTWLQQQFSAADEEIATALRVNYNRPLAALNALQRGWLPLRKQFLRQFWLFYQNRQLEPFLQQFAFKDEILLQRQLNWLSAFFSDSLKCKLQIKQGWINHDIANGIEQFSQGLSQTALLQGNQLVSQLRQDFAQINAVNQELIVLDCLSKLISDVFEKQIEV